MRNYLRAINAYLQMGNHMRPGKLMISKATPFMAAAKSSQVDYVQARQNTLVADFSVVLPSSD